MANASLLNDPRLTSVETASHRFIVRVDAALAAIGAQWQELETDGELTPFQTQAWLVPWYEIVGQALGISPLFVTVRDRVTMRPLMLMPLCLQRKFGVVTIRFPDCGVSDYNAPLLARSFEPSEHEFASLWDDITDALPKADVTSLDKMPERIGAVANPLIGLSGTRRMHMRAWGFALPKCRDDYDNMLRSSTRKRLRRERRYLELEGPVRFIRAQTEAEGRQLFETLKRQRRDRYAHLNRLDILSDTMFARFYEAAIFQNWPSGFNSLSALKVGDEFAATLFGLNHRGRHYVLLHCFQSGRFLHKSPGTVGLDSAITAEIKAGSTYFDLTVGNETYKRRFGVTENFLYSLEQGQSPKGWAYVAMREARKFAGDQIRKLPVKYWPEWMRG